MLLPDYIITTLAEVGVTTDPGGLVGSITSRLPVIHCVLHLQRCLSDESPFIQTCIYHTLYPVESSDIVRGHVLQPTAEDF